MNSVPNVPAGFHPICLALLSSCVYLHWLSFKPITQLSWKTILRLPLLLSYVRPLVSWSWVAFLEQFPKKRYMEDFLFISLNVWSCLSSPYPHWVWLSIEFVLKTFYFILEYRKSHGRRSLVGCSPWGCWELDTTEWLNFQFSLSWIGGGNGNPLQCSCLENPRDRGARWAAVSGVAQSWTQLKRLSSSSSSSIDN